MVIVNERSAAKLSSGVEERGDPRPFAGISWLATYDTLLILIAVLRAALRQIVDTRAGDGGLAVRRRGRGVRPPGRLLSRPRGSGRWFLRAHHGRFRGRGMRR